MIITITGLDKLGLKAQKDLAKVPGLLQRGLIDGGRIAEAYAADYQFAYKYGHATGQVNARYTYSLENYYTIGLYSSSDHWRFVEYGTGVFHIPDPHTAWYKATPPFRGWHQGQRPQKMLVNATQSHLAEISKKVCDTVQGGLCGA